MSNGIFLPITDKYDPCFYLDKFYNEINTAIKDLKNTKEPTSCDLTFTNLFKFSRSIEKLQEFYITEACESEFVQKHLSSVIGKDVASLEDYIEIEKILCDYYNVFTAIINNNLLYLKPFFNENYNCRIVKGIKIDFESPAKFGKMFAYRYDGKEVILKNDLDYFMDNSGDIFFLSDKIRAKNLYEIVVMSSDGKSRKRFEVDDF
ncbi:hypothetical protein NBO_43g0001 [Nosema bombycis CQ1]|uniref:Uncharacterized protein n=1 Tax=Nosema bombycis (strain CQ1 / CVCC 102059) TaxID=578461 RepID=R0MIK4_NOSB1|nr:hypothetical protein NBO_43g0001 [Nosema bombycis CQ1]|eukprot:EOB13995.1 hypothetical protein NBO_43g0001 [Nosema bombycis CQ1]